VRAGLRLKLALAYFLIIALSMTLLSYVVTRQTRSSLLSDREAALLAQANVIADVAAEYMGPGGRRHLLRPVVQGFAADVGGRILVLDREGRVLVDSAAGSELVGRRLGHSEVREALSGSAMAAPHYLLRDGWVMHTAAPIRVHKQVADAVLLSTSIPDVFAKMDALRLSLIRASLVVGTAVLLIGSLLTMAITRPLGELTRAAMDLAQGRFSRRVNISSGDEIGHLARAFNFMAGKLEGHEEMRRRFIQDASHEPKTPWPP